jgi:hypothetical protein
MTGCGTVGQPTAGRSSGSLRDRFGLLGGVIADAVDRRRLTLLASTGLAVISAVLVARRRCTSTGCGCSTS